MISNPEYKFGKNIFLVLNNLLIAKEIVTHSPLERKNVAPNSPIEMAIEKMVTTNKVGLMWVNNTRLNVYNFEAPSVVDTRI